MQRHEKRITIDHNSSIDYRVFVIGKIRINTLTELRCGATAQRWLN